MFFVLSVRDPYPADAGVYFRMQSTASFGDPVGFDRLSMLPGQQLGVHDPADVSVRRLDRKFDLYRRSHRDVSAGILVRRSAYCKASGQAIVRAGVLRHHPGRLLHFLITFPPYIQSSCTPETIRAVEFPSFLLCICYLMFCSIYFQAVRGKTGRRKTGIVLSS